MSTPDPSDQSKLAAISDVHVALGALEEKRGKTTEDALGRTLVLLSHVLKSLQSEMEADICTDQQDDAALDFDDSKCGFDIFAALTNADTATQILLVRALNTIKDPGFDYEVKTWMNETLADILDTIAIFESHKHYLRGGNEAPRVATATDTGEVDTKKAAAELDELESDLQICRTGFLAAATAFSTFNHECLQSGGMH